MPPIDLPIAAPSPGSTIEPAAAGRFGVVGWAEIVAAIEKECGRPWAELRTNLVRPAPSWNEARAGAGTTTSQKLYCGCDASGPVAGATSSSA